MISGCLTTQTQNRSDIQTHLISTFHNLTSYTFISNVTITQETINASGTTIYTSNVPICGKVDRSNDRYYNIINSTYNSPSGSISYRTQDYLINKVLYREIAAMNYSQWGKANATASDYHLFNDFAYQVFLQNYSTITALPDESVGTASCYVLKATVDIRRYYTATIGSHWADPQLHNSTLNSDINTTKEWTVTYWIAKADYQLQQMYQRTILEYLTPTHSRSTEDTTTRFRDHNAPVTIELPAEAIAANWTIFG